MWNFSAVIVLFCWEHERGVPIHWFTHWMPEISRGGPNQIREPETQSGCSTSVGTQWPDALHYHAGCIL